MKMRRSVLSKAGPIRLAVFASGSGSNFEALVKAIRKQTIEAEVALLVSDKPDAFALNRADTLAVPSVSFYPKQFPSKEVFEREVLDHLKEADIDLIVLAGYMRIIGQTLLEAFDNRIINIHPSLLPLYPGKQGIQDAFDAGAKETGVTVHLVDEGIDTGTILAQEKVVIDPDDTIESLEEKLHAVEHVLYPEVIQTYIKNLQKEYA
ncbi:phosphoribosylglycinamide formyltransferase [Aerococcus viridans ATCC 11563 = CCUG 4311]|uniref:Phosphoribosylglycinamide formyltransferase n=1 Tax=Aerococcus viridans (strain ATCC 11563 / DSM 20340 / CCUG 4311 / JCM 20461 / NBRC 12219 / NCTC 8251 / M1) TaxID=655812 RepID=A0ABP2I7M7_AERVM|nr:phosphoribosylglycinamide formyltransferase [Aerococcus viridans ATCC 11563 = CCUG 4311]